MGYLMVFVQKWPLFQPVYLGNRGKENVFHDILERKTAFLGYKKKVQKVEKLTFFQRGYLMVLVKKWQLFQPVYLGTRGKENVFHDYLAQKKNLSRL